MKSPALDPKLIVTQKGGPTPAAVNLTISQLVYLINPEDADCDICLPDCLDVPGSATIPAGGYIVRAAVVRTDADDHYKYSFRDGGGVTGSDSGTITVDQ